MKEKTKLSILIISLILLLLGMFGALIGIQAWHNKDARTPLGWCLWEIHTHENYDCEFSYTYAEINNHDDSNNMYLHAYYITVFTDERKGEWYCFIECKCDHMILNKQVYKDYEVKLIDCDLAFETLLEE